MAGDLKDGVQWLKALVAGLMAALLVVAYFEIDDQGVEDGFEGLLLELIPGAILLVLAGPIAYYAIQRWGLGKGMEPPDDAWDMPKLRDEIVTAVAELPIYEAVGGPAPEISNFWVSHHKVSWDEVIGTAMSLDIVAVYYEGWVDENRDELLSLFGRGATVRLYMTDPDAADAIKATCDRFPEHKVDSLCEKIRATARKLEALRRESGSYHARLEVHLLPTVLNYAAVRTDENFVLFSIYEHKREQRIDSPSILLDLTKSSALKRFWHKELKGLSEQSRTVDQSFWQGAEEAA